MIESKEIVFHRLSTIRDLPTLPEVIYRIESVANDPSCGAREIAAVIETDPPMAARILRLANSAYYRSSGVEIGSIAQAVARLGMKEVRKVCLAVAAMRIFVKSSRHIDHRRFWHHSLTVASATRTVAKRMHGVRVDPDEAFIAGLLHEVGALIFDQYFVNLYAIVFKESERAQRAIHLVENEYLQINHGDLGAELLSRWNLPERIVEAVRYHHNPSQATEENRGLCQLIHIADYACSTQGNPGPGEEHLTCMSTVAWRDLGLQMERLYELLDEVLAESERSSIFLALAAA